MHSPERHADGVPAPVRRPLKAYLLIGLAVITCPCHLPLLLAVLAGTALTGALSQYVGVAFVALTVIFVVSLGYGLKLWRQSERREP
ncbi:MAG: mercury resistance protein [Candidatus Rokubacteria bacterium]|nr:mercury resistance protein [Candidatus Rokubacteria bacterium]